MSRSALIRTVQVVFALLPILAAWWWFSREPGTRDGHVVLEWRGSHEGSTRLPAQLAWCPINRVATLEAISNDTGLLVTLLESDSLSNGPHAVVTAEIRDQSPRPSAVAALRWAGDSGLLGFRSVSGVVDLRATAGVASGSFEIRMRAPVATDTLVVRGDFRGLAVTSGAVGCP